MLAGPKTELEYGAEHASDEAEYFFSGPKDVIRLWNTTAQIVLVVDRSSFAAIEPLLGSYEVVAADGKKLALAHPGSLVVAPRPASPAPAMHGADG